MGGPKPQADKSMLWDDGGKQLRFLRLKSQRLRGRLTAPFEYGQQGIEFFDFRFIIRNNEFNISGEPRGGRAIG